jgi:hypothetical protein
VRNRLTGGCCNGIANFADFIAELVQAAEDRVLEAVSFGAKSGCAPKFV